MHVAGSLVGLIYCSFSVYQLCINITIVRLVANGGRMLNTYLLEKKWISAQRERERERIEVEVLQRSPQQKKLSQQRQQEQYREQQQPQQPQ